MVHMCSVHPYKPPRLVFSRAPNRAVTLDTTKRGRCCCREPLLHMLNDAFIIELGIKSTITVEKKIAHTPINPIIHTLMY